MKKISAIRQGAPVQPVAESVEPVSEAIEFGDVYRLKLPNVRGPMTVKVVEQKGAPSDLVHYRFTNTDQRIYSLNRTKFQSAIIKKVTPEAAVFEAKDFESLRTELTESEVAELDYANDPAGSALTHLNDITELADDMIATIGELDHVDLKITDGLGRVYEELAKIYEQVDIAHGIVPLDIDDDGWADYSDNLADYTVWGAADTGEGIVGVNEEIDLTKFKRLTSLGLLSPDETTKVTDAFKKLEGGKPITTKQAGIISDAFLRLVGIITGDNSILTSVSKGVKGASSP